MYIPNTYNNTLEVINTTTGAIVATIPTPKYPVGVSVSPDGTRVYVSDENPGGQSSVSVINTSTKHRN
jgi:YVTN family beta-propeller protein